MDAAYLAGMEDASPTSLEFSKSRKRGGKFLVWLGHLSFRGFSEVRGAV